MKGMDGMKEVIGIRTWTKNGGNRTHGRVRDIRSYGAQSTSVGNVIDLLQKSADSGDGRCETAID